MDRIDAMRLFLRVADAGSFSRAAADLSIGQPTVSRRIQDLEHQLGAELFHRTTRSVSLTVEGERFFEGASQLLDDMDSTYSGYLDDFLALEALGPSEDQPILAFLSEHEVAAIAFLEKARSDLNAAMTPLRNYLALPAPVAR